MLSLQLPKRCWEEAENAPRPSAGRRLDGLATGAGSQAVQSRSASDQSCRVDDRRSEYRTRYRNRNVGCGCGGFFFVLIVGTVLALVNLAVSLGVSVQIPFTRSNITVAGSIGDKDKAADVLPEYTH